MNLAQYTREMHLAGEEFRQAVMSASDQMQKRMENAWNEFTGESEAAKTIEYTSEPRRFS